MIQTILITGTILASSMGCAVVALVLGCAIKSAWKRPVLDRFTCLDFAADDLWAFRGYDSPEVYREDDAIRSRHGSCERNLH